VDRLNGGDSLLRLWPKQGRAGGSVLIRFADGGGTMLAALRGYIAHIFVENGVVTNVNYAPAKNSFRWRDDEKKASPGVPAAGQFAERIEPLEQTAIF
jgi:hypothetical protein